MNLTYHSAVTVMLFVVLLINFANSINVRFCFEQKDDGHRLNAPVLKSLSALSGPECVLHCLNHNCCRSVNYNKQYLSSKNITNCELLHEVATERPEKLKSDVKFSHLALLQPNRTLNCSCVSCPDQWYRNKCKIDHTYNWQKLPGNLAQIDNGLTAEVWGVNLYHHIFRWDEKKYQWEIVSGFLKHVSAGEAGVWGVNAHDQVYFREGVSDSDPSGTQWKFLSSRALTHIDSGPRGIVYALDRNKIYCRTGISSDAPEGTGWVMLQGSLTYVSCNVLGCYGVNAHHQVWYRDGVNKENCAGNKWIHIHGLPFKQIESGLAHDVFAIGVDDVVYRRIGLNITSPTGTGWERIDDYATHITTGLNGHYKLVKGEVFFSNEVC